MRKKELPETKPAKKSSPAVKTKTTEKKIERRGGARPGAGPKPKEGIYAHIHFKAPALYVEKLKNILEENTEIKNATEYYCALFKKDLQKRGLLPKGKK